MKNYFKGNPLEAPSFLYTVWGDLLLLMQSTSHGFKSTGTCWILMLTESLQNFAVFLSM